MCYLINNLSLSSKRENKIKQQDYSNKNHKHRDIFIKFEQQIHIKFSLGILHNVVCHRGNYLSRKYEHYVGYILIGQVNQIKNIQWSPSNKYISFLYEKRKQVKNNDLIDINNTNRIMVSVY